MSNGGYVSWESVVTGLLWGAVIVLLGSAWVLMIADPTEWRFAGLFAASACALSAFAATLHVRTYISRLCNVVRVTNHLEPGGLADDDPTEIRPLR